MTVIINFYLFIYLRIPQKMYLTRRSPSDGRNRENKERVKREEEKAEKEEIHLLARHSGR